MEFSFDFCLFLCYFQTLDAYDLSAETITNVDQGEVERIANEYIRQQATLEFVDDLVCIFRLIIFVVLIIHYFSSLCLAWFVLQIIGTVFKS